MRASFALALFAACANAQDFVNTNVPECNDPSVGSMTRSCRSQLYRNCHVYELQAGMQCSVVTFSISAATWYGEAIVVNYSTYKYYDDGDDSLPMSGEVMSSECETLVSGQSYKKDKELTLPPDGCGHKFIIENGYQEAAEISIMMDNASALFAGSVAAIAAVLAI